jgi:hypothetical protein
MKRKEKSLEKRDSDELDSQGLMTQTMVDLTGPHALIGLSLRLAVCF